MSDRIAQSLILALVLILPLSVLAARRLPLRRVVIYTAAWGGVFVLLFLAAALFT